MRFCDFAQKDPAALAVADADGTEWSRGKLFSLINRASRGLLNAGANPGDVLAIAAPSTAEAMAMYLAGTQIGLYVVPINCRLASDEIAYVLADSAARFVIADDACAQQVASALAGMTERPHLCIALGSTPGFRHVEDVIAGLSGEPLSSRVEGRAFNYTSATSGRPKGVKLPLETAAATLDHAIELRVRNGTEVEDNVYMCVSPLYHGASLQGASVAMHMGHALILAEGVDAESVLKLIERYRVTIAHFVPTMFVRLLKLANGVRNGYSTESLRQVVHTGAPCPVEVKRSMIDWWGPILWEVYAGAEGGGAIVNSLEWLRRPGTVGRAIPGSVIRIVDERGHEVPPGCVGRIYMTRYSGDKFEYAGDPSKTRAAYSGEFFTLGDVGYLDDDGYLFLRGREADTIISNGMNIYPAEVERVLALCPHVVDCAVYGIPNELAGEIVGAVIQLESGISGDRELTARILRSLAEKLAVSKLPRQVVYTSESLRGPTGKLARRILRERHSLATPRV